MIEFGAPAAITVGILLGAVGLKLTDLVKYLVNLSPGVNRKQGEAFNGLLTLFVTATVGILFVQFLLKPSAWGDEIMIGQETLKDLDLGSTVIFGIVFSAVASTLYDFKKAIDNNDSAEKPKLMP